MKTQSYLRFLAIMLSLLVITLPITFAEEFNRVYDANGNLISDGKYYREYSGLNQLIKVRLGNTSTSPIAEEYVWHPIEERIVVKRVFYNGVYNYTVYYPTKEFVRIVNSSGTFDEKYVYQDGVLVAQVDTDGNKQFIHSDHEGSNTLITDISGNVLENTFYSPYGEIIEGGKASRFDYEGKAYDSVVEDYDFGFRKFNLKIPIGNQPDTILQNVYDPQLLNRYSFERNNPYGFTDPSGHCIWDLCIVEIVTVIVTVIVTAAIGYAVGYLGGAVLSAGSQAADNYKKSGDSETQSGSKTESKSGSASSLGSKSKSKSKASRAKDAVKNIDWGQVNKDANEVGIAASISFGTQGLLNGVSLNFGRGSTTNFYSTPNGEIVPSKTPNGLKITPHAADRMGNPPVGRVKMTPEEVDDVVRQDILRKVNEESGTLTYWNPSQPGKPQVIVSDDLQRVVSVIKNKED